MEVARMSTDYSFGLVVGFRFFPDELRSKFGKPVFNGVEYIFLGKKLELVGHNDDAYEGETICDAIAEHIKCDVYASHSSETDTTEIYFCPSKLPDEMDDGDDFGGHVLVDGPMPFDAIVKLAPKMKELAAGLKKLGLKPGKAGIFITHHIS